MLKKGLASALAASIVLLSPGLKAYEAAAAPVRVSVQVPAAAMPAGLQAGAGAVRPGNLAAPAAGGIHLNLASPLISATAPGVAAPAASVQAASAREVSAAPNEENPAPEAKKGARTVSQRLKAQAKEIVEIAQDVPDAPQDGAHASGQKIIDALLQQKSRNGASVDSNSVEPKTREIESVPGGELSPAARGRSPLAPSPKRLSAQGAVEKTPAKKPSPPAPETPDRPAGPATAGGQLTASALFGGLAAGTVYAAKYVAAMSLAGWLAYAPPALTVSAWGLGLAAGGFLILGTRIALSRTGDIERGDQAPMAKPYTFTYPGWFKDAFLTPVSGAPVYLPGYAQGILRLHAKVREKAGRFAAYPVQAAANLWLLAREAYALIFSGVRMLPLIREMYRGDDEVRPFVKSHKKPMWTLQGINIAQAIMGVASSYVVGALVDAAIAKSAGLAALLVSGMLAIILANWALNTAYEWMKNKLISSVLTDFRVSLFGHILTLPFGFFVREKPSEVSARLSVDVAQLEAKNISIPVILPYYGAMALFAGIMMAATSVSLSFMVAAVIPILALISVIYGNKAERLNEQQVDRRAQMIGAGEEVLKQVRDVRSFSTEDAERARFEKKVDDYAGTVMRKSRISAAYNGGIGQLYEFSFHLLVLAAGLFSFMATGAPTVGQTMALVGYAAFMRQALSGGLSLYTQYRESTGSARRVLDYLKEKPALADAPGAEEPGPLQGALSVDGVTFSFDGKHPLLKDLSFSLKPGRHAVLVGGEGVEKSALLDLLGRLDDPDSGTISYDGKAAAGLKLAPLRRQIGLLHESGVWIDGLSLRENVTYGLKRAMSDDEIIAALKTAGAEFVLDARLFPKGLDTRLSRGDWRLSEMRKRLLELARTELSGPRLLLLDRPTSGLSQGEANYVAFHLDKISQGRTAVTVADRVEQALRADVILMMKDGRIVEQGTHEELMALKGAYYKLWRSEQAKDGGE